MVIDFILNEQSFIGLLVKPLLKPRGLISADCLIVTFIRLPNGDKKSVIGKFFYLGDCRATHQDASVQSKVPAIEHIFEFSTIVLGHPFLAGCIHQKCNLGLTDKIKHLPKVMIDRPF